jgi:pimeloyl-ACP methyl ester carboxylesterase
MEEIMSKEESKKELAPPGDMIDVNSHKMHVFRAGSGSPTVFFEAGLRSDLLAFAKVQLEVAKFTSTISYDRAGMGYSESSTNPSRRSKEIVSEFAQLVEVLEIEEPMILVGWSAGGIYNREYAAQHPEKVAGMVFIDSSHENEINRFPKEIASLEKKNMADSTEFFKEASKLSYEEILEKVDDPPFWLEYPEFFQPYIKDRLRPELFEFYTKLPAFFEEDVSQGDDALKALGDIPLTVISVATYNNPNFDDAQRKLATEVWEELQTELAELSSHNKQIKVDSGHHIAGEKPEVVIEAIKEMVEKVRNKQE